MNGLEAKPFTNRSFLHKSRGAICYGFPYRVRPGSGFSDGRNAINRCVLILKLQRIAVRRDADGMIAHNAQPSV